MKVSRRRLAALPLAALLAGPMAGCVKLPERGTLAGHIAIDGSSTVFPITEAVAEEYRNEQSRVKVTVGTSGTGGGFKKFSRGEIDINDASKRISKAQDSACKAAGIAFVELEVAYDGLVVVVNPENTWVKSMTVAELKRLWAPEAQNTITRWNQVRPEWPNEEIHLFGAGAESGTYDYFTEAIVGKSHSSRGDYTGSEDDNILVQGIAGDRLALGFFGLAYFEENKAMLRAVPVDDGKPENGDGPITASAKTVQDGTYAPLARPLFIYVNQRAARRPDVQDYVSYYLTIAPELVSEVGYVPMPPAKYVEQRKKWADFVAAHSAAPAAPAASPAPPQPSLLR